MKTAVLRCCGEDIIGIVELAVGLRDRMVGLLGRDSLGGGKAMYLSPCNCIHTFFMRFNLDLIFLDRSQRVVRIVREIRPNRIASGGAGAHSVIEMESGWFLTEKVRVGEQVELIDASTGERQA